MRRACGGAPACARHAAARRAACEGCSARERRCSSRRRTERPSARAAAQSTHNSCGSTRQRHRWRTERARTIFPANQENHVRDVHERKRSHPAAQRLGGLWSLRAVRPLGRRPSLARQRRPVVRVSGAQRARAVHVTLRSVVAHGEAHATRTSRPHRVQARAGARRGGARRRVSRATRRNNGAEYTSTTAQRLTFHRRQAPPALLLEAGRESILPCPSFPPLPTLPWLLRRSSLPLNSSRRAIGFP